MTNEAKQIYKNFRDATAALIDWPGTPRAVHQVVAKMVEEFGNELDSAPDFDGDHARKVMSNVFDLRDEGAAPRPTPAEYDPEIEARRADYERLAEALAFMTEMSGNRRWYDLDIEIKGIDTGDPRNGRQLIGAVHDHLLALWDRLDCHDARTLRRFYAELRLHADQGAIERRRAYEEFQKEEARPPVPEGFEARPRDNRWQLFRLHGKKLSANGKPMWRRTYIGSFTKEGLKRFYERERQRLEDESTRQRANVVNLSDRKRGRRDVDRRAEPARKTNP